VTNFSTACPGFTSGQYHQKRGIFSPEAYLSTSSKENFKKPIMLKLTIKAPFENQKGPIKERGDNKLHNLLSPRSKPFLSSKKTY